MNIRLMTLPDLKKVANIHQLTFSRQQRSEQWIECHFNAFPHCFCFVAESNENIIGYIIWTQKSGFRREVVLELEQLAVLESQQGKCVGRHLITESLPIVKSFLTSSDCFLKYIIVTTRADNEAQKLYQSTLGAKVEATLFDLYSADEVVMIARNIN